MYNRESAELKRAKKLFIMGKVSENYLRKQIKVEYENKNNNLKSDRKVI
jgi:hypothetical protein